MCVCVCELFLFKLWELLSVDHSICPHHTANISSATSMAYNAHCDRKHALTRAHAQEGLWHVSWQNFCRNCRVSIKEKRTCPFFDHILVSIHLIMQWPWLALEVQRSSSRSSAAKKACRTSSPSIFSQAALEVLSPFLSSVFCLGSCSPSE